MPSVLEYQAMIDAANQRAVAPIAQGQQQQIALLLEQLNQKRKIDAAIQMANMEAGLQAQRDARLAAIQRLRDQAYAETQTKLADQAAENQRIRDARLQRFGRRNTRFQAKLAEEAAENQRTFYTTRDQTNFGQQLSLRALDRALNNEDYANRTKDARTGVELLTNRLSDLEKALSEYGRVPVVEQGAAALMYPSLANYLRKQGAMDKEGNTSRDVIGLVDQLLKNPDQYKDSLVREAQQFMGQMAEISFDRVTNSDFAKQVARDSSRVNSQIGNLIDRYPGAMDVLLDDPGDVETFADDLTQYLPDGGAKPSSPAPTPTPDATQETPVAPDFTNSFVKPSQPYAGEGFEGVIPWVMRNNPGAVTGQPGYTGAPPNLIRPISRFFFGDENTKKYLPEFAPNASGPSPIDNDGLFLRLFSSPEARMTLRRKAELEKAQQLNEEP